MQYTKVDADFTMSPQIQPEDVAQVQAAGFKSIICTRPEQEEPGQPAFSEIALEAERLGMPIVQIPVSGAPTQEQMAHFNETMDDFPSPVFGYCRSGNRARNLYVAYLNRD